jgi:hypothetical protein
MVVLSLAAAPRPALPLTFPPASQEVTVLVYATPTELTAWPVTPTPPNAAALLRSASILVRRATLTAYYAADAATGAPTNPAVVAAFRDATCAQAAMWAAAKIDPIGGEAGDRVASARTIGSASVTYGDAAATAKARAVAAAQLCQEARLILADAGLTGGQPWTFR